MYVKEVPVKHRLKTPRKLFLKFGLSSLFAITIFSSRAQFILPGQFFDEQLPMFHEDTIADRKISTLTLKMLRKPARRPIYDDGKRIRYTFNKAGKVTSYRKVFPGRHGRLDTTEHSYTYNNGELASHYERSGRYARNTVFKVISGTEKHVEVRVKRGDQSWQLIRKEVVHTKNQQGELNTRQIEEISGEGSPPYQKRISTLDLKGRLTSKEVWNGSRAQSIETWVWRDDLIEAYFSSDLVEETNVRIEYQLTVPRQEEGTWCVEDSCRNWSIVHHPDGRPKGWIFMDPKTDNMEIWEFYYEYR